ncbi:hypothetical protein [Dactylosporangium sp. CA-139066]|uniref:hypothetical protein n=1 Tax=Dactylosporangium sp. CA-139066 TaxID=3239930 RepID=UPI003D903B8A
MIEGLVERAGGDDEDAIEELVAIADSEPGRLGQYHARMLQLDVLWPGKLYRGAGEGVVSDVIAQVEAGQELGRLNHLLLVLAHSGHPLAEGALRRWAEAPAPGFEALHVGPLAYAREGGWSVDADGRRRELCAGVAYEWLIRDAAPRADRPGCPWCRSPLWRAAELDAGETDALRHTGWSGRLTVETCAFCSCYTTLYSRVQPDGGAAWWDGNARPDYLGDGEAEEPPNRVAVAGPRRPGPYQASAWGTGGSTLGGHPDWIQDAEHPDCPECGRAMDYVGLIGGADLDEYGEGAYYIHLHAPCGFAAVNYQQS